MNNSSLIDECYNPVAVDIEADPDIAGIGVRADSLRKWLD